MSLKPLGLAARDLNQLERYERRALSRRKCATETFMAINLPLIPKGLKLCDLELMKNENTTKSQFLAERTQIPNGESSSTGAACPPFSTNSNVGAGKSLPSAGSAQPRRSQNLGEPPT